MQWRQRQRRERPGQQRDQVGAEAPCLGQPGEGHPAISESFGRHSVLHVCPPLICSLCGGGDHRSGC